MVKVVVRVGVEIKIQEEQCDPSWIVSKSAVQMGGWRMEDGERRRLGPQMG